MTDNLLSGRRVLVVEDEMMVAMLLEHMLAELGCEVIGPAANVGLPQSGGPVSFLVHDVSRRHGRGGRRS
jgi:CheY-like chemotaxis protein